MQHQALRRGGDRVNGERAEQWDLLSGLLAVDLKLAHEVSPAVVFDELQGSVWIKSTCGNVRFGLHLVFPRQIDPRTGAALEVDLLGDRYTDTDKWQQLLCRTTDEALRNLLIRVRAQLANAPSTAGLDDREVIVSHAVLIFDAPPGPSFLRIDDLKLSPVVAPTQPFALRGTQSEQVRPRLQVQDDRILKDGRPFFPLFTSYLGESLETIASSAVNMLWIEDPKEQRLLQAMDSAGIGAIAPPPPIAQEEALLGKEALVPFPDWTAPIWAWTLGKEVPTSELAYLSYWAQAVRDADRRLRRPLIADVLGAEREFHRPLSLLGASEYSMHTGIDPEDYLRRLRARQNSALPGKPMFTFIATEPAQVRIDAAPSPAAVPILEPEQIWLQGYTALAAGFKAIGFGRRSSFDDPSPGLNERALAMKLFNQHVRVLEPWLATGRFNYQLDARIGDGQRKQYGGAARSPLASSWDKVVPARGEKNTTVAIEDDAPVRASVFQTDYGMLILLVWYEPGAQFVPGPQQAHNVKILVRGDAVQAWEVTSTEVGTSNLTMGPVSGGTQIQLKTFDQHAAIVLTRDMAVIDVLKKSVRAQRRETAGAYLQLTQLKLDRVRNVHEELASLQVSSVPQARNWLAAAERSLHLAQREYDAGHDDDACEFCRQAMAVLRRLQREHWENAQSGAFTSPMTSPYACSFQTLPEHWRMVARISHKNITSANLLPSGGFEDHLALETSWGYEAPSSLIDAGIDPPRVELVPDAAQGERALSITLTPHNGIAASSVDANEGAWAMLTPEVPFRPGELLFISGRVNIPHQLDTIGGGLVLFDTLLGRAGALRFARATDGWQRFHLIREAHTTGTMRLRFEMHTFGTVLLDDISVVALKRPR